MFDLYLNGINHLIAEGPDDEVLATDRENLIQSYLRPDQVCLQVGVHNSKAEKWGPNFVAIDKLDQRPCIDFQCDLASLPFPDGHFDFVICRAILEHVEDPFACAREIVRVCDAGADIWLEVPFVQPFHPYKTWVPEHGHLPTKPVDLKDDEDHGGDFWRFTPQGIHHLMKPCAPIKIYVAGPGGIGYWCKKP